MSGIFVYIWLEFMVNVGKSSIRRVFRSWTWEPHLGVDSVRLHLLLDHPGCRMNLWENSIGLAGLDQQMQFQMYMFTIGIFYSTQMIFAVCEHIAYRSIQKQNPSMDSVGDGIPLRLQQCGFRVILSDGVSCGMTHRKQIKKLLGC